MSKSEILTELPKLTPEERQEVRELLANIDGTDWLDDGELTDEEKSLIDARLDECERNPGSFIPWNEARITLVLRTSDILRESPHQSDGCAVMKTSRDTIAPPWRSRL